MKAIREAYKNACEYKEVQVKKVSDEISKIVPNAIYYREEGDKYFIYEKWNSVYDTLEGVRVEAKFKIGDEYFEENYIMIPTQMLKEF